ncbi:hypothetical protein TNCV_2281161 [Trichonephila clavipes]|nr:hypothetical protein TNCV_2281161 [Trichonephila clavipes]
MNRWKTRATGEDFQVPETKKWSSNQITPKNDHQRVGTKSGDLSWILSSKPVTKSEDETCECAVCLTAAESGSNRKFTADCE